MTFIQSKIKRKCKSISQLNIIAKTKIITMADQYKIQYFKSK